MHGPGIYFVLFAASTVLAQQRPSADQEAHNANYNHPYAQNQEKGPSLYAVKAVDFNSAGMDFSPFPYQEGVVFVSSRSKKGNAEADADEFLRLFYTRESEDGTFSEPKVLEPKILSPYHEGPVVFFDHGNKKMFTRNSVIKTSKLKDGSVSPLELAQSERAGPDKWTEPVTLPFAGPGYSVAHPAISSDGNTLYFSSNMPGTVGESDLFVSQFDNGTWSVPRNLGAAINTTGQELFPFLYNDSILFYSSNGRGGLGGLDLFYCNVKEAVPTVIRLEAPLNSEADDFGFYMEAGGASGFFSSNRGGGRSADDIYYFEEIRTFAEIKIFDSFTGKVIRNAMLTLQCGKHVAGQARSDLMGEAQFSVSPSASYKLFVSASDYKSAEIDLNPASWSAAQRPQMKVYLQASRQAISPSASVVNGRAERKNVTNMITFSSSPLDVDLAVEGPVYPSDTVSMVAIDSVTTTGPLLEIIVVEIVNDVPAIIMAKNDTIYEFRSDSATVLVNRDLGLTIDIPRGAKRHDYEEIVREQILSQGYGISSFLLIRSFFFDSGKTWIRNDASAQLDKIIEIMHAYPQFQLQMIFHSDSRGTQAFNLDLSKARAAQVTAYLTRAGIIKERIHSSFVGETQLLNDCGDLSDCDDLLHQINRTTEFKFIIR